MSRALRPALTLCACIATVGLSACSAASTDGSGDSASSDAHGLTSVQSGAPTAQSGSSGGLYETGYLQLGQCLLAAPQADVPLELVDCAQEHGAEVIHTFDLTMTTMPSEDTLDDVSEGMRRGLHRLRRASLRKLRVGLHLEAAQPGNLGSR